MVKEVLPFGGKVEREELRLSVEITVIATLDLDDVAIAASEAVVGADPARFSHSVSPYLGIIADRLKVKTFRVVVKFSGLASIEAT